NGAPLHLGGNGLQVRARRLRPRCFGAWRPLSAVIPDGPGFARRGGERERDHDQCADERTRRLQVVHQLLFDVRYSLYALTTRSVADGWRSDRPSEAAPGRLSREGRATHGRLASTRPPRADSP